MPNDNILKKTPLEIINPTFSGSHLTTGDFRDPEGKESFKKKTILGLLVLFFLVGGLGSALVLVEQQQEIRKKAAEPPTIDAALEKVVKLAEEIAFKPNLQTYRADNYGYQASFDKNFWQEEEGTDLKEANLKKVAFGLRKDHGIAFVSLNASTPGDLVSILKDKASSQFKGDTLDFLASRIEKTQKAAGKERIKRGGKDFYKLTFKESFLGQESKYYEYTFIENGRFYTFVAKYPELEGPKVLAEALIDSFSFFNPEEELRVQGIAAQDKDQLLDEARVVELTKPSVVQILQVYCNEIKTTNPSHAKFLKPYYSQCGATKGSGFIISQQGHIATNGHIVKTYPEEALFKTILSSRENFSYDLLKEASYLEKGTELSDTVADSLFSEVSTNPTSFGSFAKILYQLLDQKVISVNQQAARYFVRLGDEPFSFDSEKIKKGQHFEAVDTSLSVKEAELVGFSYPNRASPDAVLRGNIPQGTDLGLVRVKGAEGLSFPALELGSIEGTKEGASLLVIGYPGIVEGSSEPTSLLGYESSVNPTVTRGIVSAIKTDQAGRKLVQTDASIEHGNSGGPALNSKGEVVGIATYAFESQSGNYNFLRDVDDLKQLLNQHNVEAAGSKAYELWYEGLSRFWARQYRDATRYFGKLKEIYPMHPLLGSYIKDAQAAIERGEDRSGIYVFKYISRSQLTLAVVGIVEAIILLLIAFIQFRDTKVASLSTLFRPIKP